MQQRYAEWTPESLGDKVIVVSESGCWVWMRTASRDGYGMLDVKHDGKRIVYAHRLAYAKCFGPIPNGLFVCHRCDVPPCVNPDHLWLGTNSDNMRDMYDKRRRHNPTPKLKAKKAKRAKITVNRPNSFRGKVQFGENNTRARLKDADVISIRQSDESIPALANLYGVSRSHIHAILKGVKWPHLISPAAQVQP